MSVLHIGIISALLATARGGSERVAANVANAMVSRGHRVTVFTFSSSQGCSVYPLDSNVTLRFMDASDQQEAVQANRHMFALTGLDVCVAMQGYWEQLLFILEFLGTGIPYILSEHSCPTNIERYWSRKGRLAAMSGADAIHMLLPGYLDSLPDFLRARACCIPNPAPDVFPSLASPAGLPGKKKILLSVGRNFPIKQIPILIRAFQKIEREFPDWRLEIWGRSKDRKAEKELDDLVKGDASISLCGETDDAMGVFSHSQLFCIPSRYEGMPNTLLEAMRCGLPVVGFAGCPGVNEIIKHGVNGLLAPEMTEESLVGSLIALMADADRRIAMGEASTKLLAPFEPQLVYDQWERLFRRVAMRKGRTRMDVFAEEPFASRATLCAAARREYIFRNFGEPMPHSFSWFWNNTKVGISNMWKHLNPFFDGNRHE